MTTLNPLLRKIAQQRARELIADAEYHDGRARALRAQADSLARTWNFVLTKEADCEWCSGDLDLCDGSECQK